MICILKPRIGAAGTSNDRFGVLKTTPVRTNIRSGSRIKRMLIYFQPHLINPSTSECHGRTEADDRDAQGSQHAQGQDGGVDINMRNSKLVARNLTYGLRLSLLQTDRH